MVRVNYPEVSFVMSSGNDRVHVVPKSPQDKPVNPNRIPPKINGQSIDYLALSGLVSLCSQ